MKVWVENSSVQDINGRVFYKTGGDTAAGGGLKMARSPPEVGQVG
jgi:hypothetical protein